LKAVRKANEKDLEAIADGKQRAVRLAELNVENGVKMLEANIVVEEAMKERGLKVHGCIYDVGCGLIRDLGCSSDGAGVASVGAQKEEAAVRGNHGVLVFGGDSATMTVR
jgi:carbonic anhydrase